MILEAVDVHDLVGVEEPDVLREVRRRARQRSGEVDPAVVGDGENGMNCLRVDR